MVQLLPDLDRKSERRGFKILPALSWWTLESRGNDSWPQLIGSLGARRRESKWEAPPQCEDHWRQRTQNRSFAQENVGKAEDKVKLIAPASARNKPAESFDTSNKDFETNSYLDDILKCKQSRQTKKLLYWQCNNNNLHIALCKRRTCQQMVKLFSWELLCQKKTSGYIKNKCLHITCNINSPFSILQV